MVPRSNRYIIITYEKIMNHHDFTALSNNTKKMAIAIGSISKKPFILRHLIHLFVDEITDSQYC